MMHMKKRATCETPVCRNGKKFQAVSDCTEFRIVETFLFIACDMYDLWCFCAIGLVHVNAAFVTFIREKFRWNVRSSTF